MSTMLEAIHSNDIDRVRAILQSDPSCVNASNCLCKTPLHEVFEGHSKLVQDDKRLSIVQLLIDSGANVNSQADRRRRTPLHVAALANQLKGVELLLEHGADPNMKDARRHTSLHIAIFAPDANITRLLVEYGADISLRDSANKTPFMYAIEFNRLAHVKVLLEAGADPNIRWNRDKYPLFVACMHKNMEMLELLLDYGANPVGYRDRDNKTLLHVLAHISQFSNIFRNMLLADSLNRAVQKLINLGININARDNSGNTALHICILSKNKDFARVLLKVGANANIKDNLGNTPLDLLLHRDLFVYLKEDVYHVMNDSARESHNKFLKFIKLLVEHRADLHDVNQRGFTTFEECLLKGQMELIKIFLVEITQLDEWVVRENMQELTSLDVLSIETSFEVTRNRMDEMVVAVIVGCEVVVDRLISMGYNVNTRHRVRRDRCVRLVMPAMYHAVLLRRYESAKMMLEAGCRIDKVFLAFPELEQPHTVEERLACLIWKYSKSLVANNLFDDHVRLQDSLASVEFERALKRETPGTMRFVLVFCYAIELLTKRQERVIFSPEGCVVNNTLSPIVTFCHDKLNELKKIAVGGFVSQYDILVKDTDTLVGFLHNKEAFEACELLRATLETQKKLDYHEYLILECLNIGIEKKKLIDKATSILNNIYQFISNEVLYIELPVVVTANIIKFLNVRDLKVLTTRVQVE